MPGYWLLGTGVNFYILGKIFFLPLILSPVIAVVLSNVLYRFFHAGRKAAGITEESCVCIGNKSQPVPAIAGVSDNFIGLPVYETASGSMEDCRRLYQGKLVGIQALEFDTILS